MGAALVCVMGLIFTVASDVIEGASGGPSFGSDAWFGDMLVLCGACLYGISNVMQEGLLKEAQRRCETLGMLGLFGTIVSFSQCALLERTALTTIVWNPHMVLSLIGFQLCLFCMYVFTSTFLLAGDAAAFNLSVLTSDFYSVVYSCQVERKPLTWMYSTAFATTITGLCLYHAQPEVHSGQVALTEPLLQDPEDGGHRSQFGKGTSCSNSFSSLGGA